MDKQPPSSEPSKSERLSRFIVAIVTCLGAAGMLALLYFPLHYMK